MTEAEIAIQPPGTAPRLQWHYAPVDVTVPPFVTVITPFFDTGRVFEQTCASLLGQSFQQWEWIIINDASCDSVSLAVLAALRDVDPRIKVLDQTERRGPAAARNLAANAAKSPYLFFLDSDDLLEPTALEKMIWCLESHPEWAVCKGYTRAFEGQSYIAKAGFDQAWLFLDRNPISLTALVRCTTFIEVGGFDDTMRTGLEDWDFWLRLAARGYWGYTIPEILDWYRRRRTHADRWQSWTDRGVRQVRRTLRRRYPALYRHGIAYIHERPLQTDGLLREDTPFENFLLGDQRSLLILPLLETAAEIPAGSVTSDSALTVVALEAHSSLIPVPLFQLEPDVFVLTHFLHATDYLRFLLYLIHSRKFEQVILWDCPLTLNLYPFLQKTDPLPVFKRLGVDGKQMLTTFSPSGKVMPEQALVARALSDYVSQQQIHQSVNRAVRQFERLKKFGALGVELFLLKERIWWWGRLFKETLWPRLIGRANAHSISRT